MLSILLTLLLIWLFIKLGIGLLKIMAFLVVAGIIFVFFTHLLLPLLAICLVGSLAFSSIK